MTDSQELLADYATTGSEAAFRELVSRYIDLVFSTALRSVGGDAHRAQDVVQTVFTDLARQAPKLPADTMLGGWLHRNACFVAAKLLRGEGRRQMREREAAEMNALNRDETAWTHIGPVLDEAINELAEEDRRAILLRFYERMDLRAIGKALGGSENAAQKRVSRALEKLHMVLKRRGITSTAAALSVALSANAVQTAPAGLAASVSSAALAGTALHTAASSAAAVKAITMTTMRKALVAALLVGAVGAGIYQQHRFFLRAAEAQTLRQEQEALAEQVQGLERERDEATNLLAAAKEDNARLKSGQMQTELLRLRGQAGALRQALTTNGAGAYPTVVSRLMQDPAMRSQTREEMRRWIQFTYGPLFKQLKLTPEQTDQALALCGDAGLKMAESFAALTPGTLSQAELAQLKDHVVADLDRQLQPLLGERGVARLKEIRDALPGRTTVMLLNGQLGANQLSDEQAARLVQVVKAEPLDLTESIIGWGDKAFWGTPQDIQDHLSNLAQSNQRILQQAGGFLTSEQLSALSMVLSNDIQSRIAFAAAYIQKH